HVQRDRKDHRWWNGHNSTAECTAKNAATGSKRSLPRGGVPPDRRHKAGYVERHYAKRQRRHWSPGKFKEECDHSKKQCREPRPSEHHEHARSCESVYGLDTSCWSLVSSSSIGGYGDQVTSDTSMAAFADGNENRRGQP